MASKAKTVNVHGAGVEFVEHSPHRGKIVLQAYNGQHKVRIHLDHGDLQTLAIGVGAALRSIEKHVVSDLKVELLRAGGGGSA